MTAGPSRTVRRRRLLAALLAGYLLVLSLIVFWPSPVDEGASGFIARVLRFLHRNGAPEWFDYSLIESGANVLLFIPFGIFVAAHLPVGRMRLAVVAGMGASVLIEVVQEILLAERFATVPDALANSVGAALGTMMTYARSSRKRDPPVG